MSTPAPLNLDRLAAHHAQRMVKRASDPGNLDALVTRTLGVIQENGVYAGVLTLLSRTRPGERDLAQVVVDELVALADALPFDWEIPRQRDPAALLAFYSDTVCASLSPLLLVKEVYEQALIYARYGAKAQVQNSKLQTPPAGGCANSKSQVPRRSGQGAAVSRRRSAVSPGGREGSADDE